MDICVITNDALIARFIVLELAEAGYSAMHSEVLTKAKLHICDLDFTNDIPSESIGFSYDETKRELVQSFLQRPIDAEKLRTAVAKKLSAHPIQKRIAALEIDLTKRKVKADNGEVRLSEKELSLFKMLCEKRTITRDNGMQIFGEGDSNIVDVYIHYLRKKLAKVCDGETIKAKRGEGYSISDRITVKFI